MKFGPENKWFKTSYLKFIFSFQIFEQKVSKPTKTSKKDHSFYNAVLPKKPYPFSEPQLTQLSKNILPAAHPKTLHALQTFQQTCFWLVSEKNIGTAPFPDAQELHSRSTWKANVCILRSSHRRCFGKKGVLGNFTIFTGKHLCKSCKACRKPFLPNTSGRLLLYIPVYLRIKIFFSFYLVGAA